MKRLQTILQQFLNRPMLVFWICAVVLVSSLAMDGSAFHLWGLIRDRHDLENRIQQAGSRSQQLDFQIHQASQPEFIERQARDQFDLVKEGDLVFVFSDDTEAE